MMAFDLWTEASYDAEEDNREQRFTAARVAIAPLWTFLGKAESRDDFENRMAMVAEQIDGACARVAEGAEFTALRHAVDQALQRDYRVMDDARKHALREEFLCRKRVRQANQRLAAMRKQAEGQSAEEARSESISNPVNDERHSSNTPEGGEHAGSKEDCPICSGGSTEARRQAAKGPRPFVFKGDLLGPPGDAWHEGFEDGYSDARGGGGSPKKPDNDLYQRGYENGQAAGAQQVPTDAAGYGPTTIAGKQPARKGPGPTGDADRCPRCWGKGWVDMEGMGRAPDCPDCKGTGIKKGAAKLAYSSGYNTNDPVPWQTTTIFTDQPLSGGGEVASIGFATLSVRPNPQDGTWHWAVVTSLRPNVVGEAPSKEEAKQAAEQAFFSQGGQGQQTMFSSRKTAGVPSYVLQAIQDMDPDGGEQMPTEKDYDTFEQNVRHLYGDAAWNAYKGWGNQEGDNYDPSADDNIPGAAFHARRHMAGRYCETHNVWIGEGNEANHDEACSIKEKATEGSRRTAESAKPFEIGDRVNVSGIFDGTIERYEGYDDYAEVHKYKVRSDTGGGMKTWNHTSLEKLSRRRTAGEVPPQFKKKDSGGGDDSGGDSKPEEGGDDGSEGQKMPPPPPGYDMCTGCAGTRINAQQPGTWCPVCNGTGITQHVGQDQPAQPQQQPAPAVPAPPVQAMRKGAPFADYEDFDDCTSQNSDKDDPDAYCGEIKHKTEDKKEGGRRQAQYGTEYEYDEHFFNVDEEIANTTTPWVCPLGHINHTQTWCEQCGRDYEDREPYLPEAM